MRLSDKQKDTLENVYIAGAAEKFIPKIFLLGQMFTRFLAFGFIQTDKEQFKLSPLGIEYAHKAFNEQRS